MQESQPYIPYFDNQSYKLNLDTTGLADESADLGVILKITYVPEPYSNETEIIKGESYHRLKKGSYSEIGTTISFNGSLLDLSIDLTEIGNYVSVDNLFDLKNVNVEVIKEAKYPEDKSINFVVMADGFRGDQMDVYRKYVKHTFKDSGSFHYVNPNYPFRHIDNHLFSKFWDRIRVIRFDTISLESGIDEYGKDNIANILGTTYKQKGDCSGSEATVSIEKIREIINNRLINGIRNIDAVIVFVNGNCGNLTWIWEDMMINERNKEPVKPILIATFYNSDYQSKDIPEEGWEHDNFHSGVQTDSICHELGHAIGNLYDERENRREDVVYPYPFEYWDFFRNITDGFIDNTPRRKWDNFIKLGYNNSLNNPVDYIWKEYLRFKDDPDDKKYFVPTQNSTMTGRGRVLTTTQYGPVNTYILVGSFLKRIGFLSENDYFNIEYDEINNVQHFEWTNYSVVDFKNGKFLPFISKFPPEEF